MFGRPVLAKLLESTFYAVTLLLVPSQLYADTTSATSIYEQPHLLTASIYAHNSEPARLLFKFRRSATRSGSTINVLREYFYPDGRAAALERVSYDGNSLKSYQLQELQTGSLGSAKVSEDLRTPGSLQVNFQYSKDASYRTHQRTSRETVASGVLVDDMVGAFVSQNYDKLNQGLKVSCRYIVVSRRETVGLSFSKESETNYQGRDAVILKLQPTSYLIAALVDPLYFTVEKAAPHHVLKYVGRTTPKIGEPGHWKDLDAVTVFDW